MENPRPEKIAVVDEVREQFERSAAAIITEYRGLKVSDLAQLRANLAEAGGSYRIFKNTLVRFAAREQGIDELEALFTGPTAITFIEGDVVAVAKAMRDFAKTNPNLVVKGGVLGTSFIDARETAALAELPSRETLLAQIAGAFAAPMQQFAGLLQALPRNMAYGLQALIDQKGGAPEPEPEAKAEEPQAAAAEPEAASADAATDEAPTEAAAPASTEDAAPAEVPATDAAPADDVAAAQTETTEGEAGSAGPTEDN